MKFHYGSYSFYNIRAFGISLDKFMCKTWIFLNFWKWYIGIEF
jgi:hypothetical protein